MSNTNEISQSTAAAEENVNTAELAEPTRKRLRLELEAVGEAAGKAEPKRLDLSERLRFVMLCNVCHDVPHPDENYQCPQGHIICDVCVTRILAEAAMRKKKANCPHCRIRISWPELCNSLALKQALWEMPTRCPQCDIEVDFKNLAQHLQADCGSRKVSCQYHCLGCRWLGSFTESAKHEAICSFPNKSGEEILSVLRETDGQDQWEEKGLRLCHTQLSAQRIFYQNVDLKFAYTSTSLHVLESAPLLAFEEQWSVIVQLGSYLDGEQRQLSYRLALKSTPRQTLNIAFMVLMPARADTGKQMLDIDAHMYKECFREGNLCSGYRHLPMASSNAIFRFLAMPSICLRLWMFLK